MKKLLKGFFINLLGFIFVWQYLPSIQLTGRFEALMFAALVLTLLDKFVKPILKAIMIPINFITFGLFNWIVTVLVFYITTILTKDIQVVDFTFNGFNTDFLIIPKVLVQQPWTYVISALSVVILTKIIKWVFKPKADDSK